MTKFQGELCYLLFEFSYAYETTGVLEEYNINSGCENMAHSYVGEVTQE